MGGGGRGSVPRGSPIFQGVVSNYFWGGSSNFFWGGCLQFFGGGGLQFFRGGWSPIFRGGVSPIFWGVSKFFFFFFPPKNSSGMHQPPPETVNARAVRVLLECILVLNEVDWKSTIQLQKMKNIILSLLIVEITVGVLI